MSREVLVAEMETKGTWRYLRVVLPIAVLLVVGVGVAAGGLVPPQAVRLSDVSDIDTARAYLNQRVTLYLPSSASGGVQGTFEFGRVTLQDVLKFQAAQGIADQAWMSAADASVIVASWTTSEVRFQAPRPRHGVDASLDGDTFIVILEPEQGLEIAAVVSSQDIDALRNSAVGRVQEPLLIRPSD